MKIICSYCKYWTRNPLHLTYRCRVGSCPDLNRKEKNSMLYAKHIAYVVEDGEFLSGAIKEYEDNILIRDEEHATVESFNKALEADSEDNLMVDGGDE